MHLKIVSWAQAYRSR